MIKIELINLKIKVEEDVARAKLWLSQKEGIEYSNWKSVYTSDRTAYDKVVAQLKLEDEEWLQKEEDLISQEVALKLISVRLSVLQDTLKAMSNPNSGITNEMFQELQELYLKDIKDLL